MLEKLLMKGLLDHGEIMDNYYDWNESFKSIEITEDGNTTI